MVTLIGVVYPQATSNLFPGILRNPIWCHQMWLVSFVHTGGIALI